MIDIMEKITGGLDWLFTALVSPVFIGVAQGLDMLLLRPLGAVNTPIALQTAIIAVLTGCLSWAVRALLKVEKQEMLFQEKFKSKRAEQQNIELISDWKTRDTLYRSTDSDIDEDFNTYLALRFARHTAVYLLPVFMALFWLDNAMPKEKLMSLVGGPYALPLPTNSYGIEGLSVPFVFLVVYVVSLICLFKTRKYFVTRKASLTLTS